MDHEMRSQLIWVLTKHQEVFTWTLTDMLEIHRSVIKHHLSMNPDAKKFWHKKEISAQISTLR